MAASPLDYVDPAQVRAGNAGGGIPDANGDGWNDDLDWTVFVPGGWLLKQATGNFGKDDASAVRDAAQADMGYLEKARAGAEQAGQQAQAGLDPYAQAGTDALAQQRALAGLDGPEAQQRAIAQLQQSPAFMAQIQQQEQGILANASATGGLRGGNVQQALAQNRSQTLSDIIAQQYGQLGGLAGAGQQAASQQGAFGLNGAGMTANVLGQQGQAASGSIIGQQAALNAGRDKAINYGLQAAGTAAGAIL